MPHQISAIIAALNAAHEQHSQFDEDETVDIEVVNRWIRVAPLDEEVAENLLLEGNFQDEVENRDLLGHIGAVRAYLQVLQEKEEASLHQKTGNSDPIEGEIIPPEQLALTRKKFW